MLYLCNSYSFKCNDKNANKVESISESQVKTFQFVECLICLFGVDYQKECVNYVLLSKNYEIDLHEANKNSLSNLMKNVDTQLIMNVQLIVDFFI